MGHFCQEALGLCSEPGAYEVHGQVLKVTMGKGHFRRK